MIFNSHTHIGDAFIKLKRKYSLEGLVAPGGYKHKMLEMADEKIILEGMKRAMDIMEKCGTDVFVDFREGGVEGARLLKKALAEKKLEAIILGRPKEMRYDEEEMDSLIDICQGVGLSSYSDWNEEEIRQIAEHVKKRKKIFALHVSEARRENIHEILELKPDFVVHLCKATEDDINEIVKRKIGVVVCPRANEYFGLEAPLKILMEKKAIVMLGTDNAMIVKPNIIEEMEYVKRKYGLEEKEAFKLISNNPLKMFGEILKKEAYSYRNEIESKRCNG
ncbi:MAG: amidohydrolase family protein [Thermoplasmata archaeon]|nr:amidohydrolase family protein [Thermoplasmata archaeon]